MGLISKRKSLDRGRDGEDLVAKRLQREGWQILERNFRVPGSEIDLIAQKDSTVVFVEVKTRHFTDSDVVSLEFLVSPSQIRSLCRGISAFMQRHTTGGATFRLDLALVQRIRRYSTVMQHEQLQYLRIVGYWPNFHPIFERET